MIDADDLHPPGEQGSPQPLPSLDPRTAIGVAFFQPRQSLAESLAWMPRQALANCINATTKANELAMPASKVSVESHDLGAGQLGGRIGPELAVEIVPV